MKRINMILVAFALVVIMAQCKKNEEINPNETVTITFDAKRSNGSRVDVNTATGTVDFETGDKVYVGSGGKYVGFLTHNGTNFVGNITNPTEGQPLQFYFLGNVTPAETLAAGTTESCSVVISDQTEHLPVISCAASYENYVSGVTSYTGHLLNKCALVKFNVTTPSNSPICITGMKNKVTVDFTQNTVTPSIDGEGLIMLPAGSGENVEKWAILLPQEALEEGEEGTAYSENGDYTGIRPGIPNILNNDFLSQGINIEVNSIVVSDIPVGAINGLFTINSSGDQVYFSQGNLQYIGSASTPYWRFAENQWEFIGVDNQGGATQFIDRDLFGWGTSGYNHGAVCYQPWSYSMSDQDYYAYGLNWTDLNDMTGQADWGYNAIFNGGNQENQWRTLQSAEWVYLLHARSTSSGIRYAKAMVNGVNGIIILPDNWSESYFSLYLPDYDRTPFDGNTISSSDWASFFECNGAVFLPASSNNSNTGGIYWSATGYNVSNSHSAHLMLFSNTQVLPDDGYYDHRYYRLAVRLVQDY
jgi:hypothetical protein